MTEPFSEIRAALSGRIPHLRLHDDSPALMNLVTLACTDAVAYASAARVRAGGEPVTPESVIQTALDRLGAPHDCAQENPDLCAGVLDLCLLVLSSVLAHVK